MKADETFLRSEYLLEDWESCMRRGDFEAAWQISEIQLNRNKGFSCKHLPRHLQYVWNGTPLKNKRVLIRCYHGLGDTIQFIRYLPFVEKIAASTYVCIQPALIPLVKTMNSSCVLLPLTDQEPDLSYDVDFELMELPFVFRTTLETIPVNVPYFHINALPMNKSDRLRVGVVWEAGDWDTRRNIPYELVTSVMEIPDISFYILQRGSAMSQNIKEIGISSGSDDIFTAARIIKSLDLVISIDSMPAHLAAALGVKTWTLLHSNPDWRWMLKREDSPWYPTMRLFRQKQAEQWKPVIEQVKEELIKLLKRQPNCYGSFKAR